MAACGTASDSTAGRPERGFYGAIEREGAMMPWPRRGDMVAISGEPGMAVYRVIAVDPRHGCAVIRRVGDRGGETWRVPAAALKPA